MKLVAIIAIFFSSINQISVIRAEEEELKYQFIEETEEETWDNLLVQSNAFPDEMLSDIELYATLTKDYRIARITCNNEYGYAYISFLRLDGEPVFCLEPLATIHWDADYYETTAWWDLATWQQDLIWKYAYYGYAYPGHQNDRYYLASQLLIWEVVDRWYDPFTADNSSYYDVTNEINEIKWLAENASRTPSFNGQTIDLALGLPVTLTDTNNALSGYNISGVEGIQISAAGNKMTLTLNSENYAKSASYSPANSGGYGTPIVYKAPGSQNVMKVTPYDPLKPFSIQFNWGDGNGKLVKKNEDGKGVPGVQFQIATDSQFENILGIYTTGEDAAFTINNIKARRYYVKEIAAPEQYVIDTETKLLDVYPNQTASIEVNDEFIKGKVMIKKTDSETHNPLEGAVFGVYNEQNKRLQELVIQANGAATSEYLRFGKYYVKEEIAPTGYVVDAETKHWFNVRTHKETIEIDAENKPQKGQIILRKLDEETGTQSQGDASLKGVSWVVFADEDIVGAEGTVHFQKDDLVEQFTAEDEIGTSSLLPLGKYRVEELSAGEGYLTNDRVIHVELTPQEQTVEVDVQNFDFSNQVIKGSFEITKYVDEKINFMDKLFKQSEAVKIPGEGFVFDVYLKSTGEIFDTITTDENGHATSKMLPYGVYILKERPVKGYQHIDDIEVQIKENAKKLHYIIENSVIRSELTLYKVDSQTQKIIPAAGVSFKLKDEKGNYVVQTVTYPQKVEIDTFVTDESGSVHFPESLIYGTYFLCEIQAPYGYVLPEGEIEIVVDGSSKEIYLNVENDAAMGRLVIEKKGEFFTGYQHEETDYGILYTPIYDVHYLSGVKFQIIAREDIIGEEGTIHYHQGDLVEELVTLEETPIVSKDLPLGAYTLQEVETPLGYVLDQKRYNFDLIYENQTTPIVLETMSLINQRQTVALNITKILEGIEEESVLYNQVQFGIFTSEETEKLPEKSLVALINFNEDGSVAKQPELLEGKYYLKELGTANGYLLDDTEYFFEVVHEETDSECLEIEINDSGEIVNKLKRVDVEIYKVNQSNHNILLNGAVFEVYDKTHRKSLGKFVSGTAGEGKLIIEDVAYGTELEVKEIQAPTGYQCVMTSWIFVVDSEQKTMTFTFENSKIEVPNMGENRS